MKEESNMIVTKQYLSNMIKEETQMVLTEREIKFFLENSVLPFIREQKKLLSEQQQELIEEGIKELFSGIKGAVSKGWGGIKSLLSSFLRIIKALPIATSVTSALGYALVHTEAGKQVTAATVEAVIASMKNSAEGTQYAQKVLNVGADFLNYLGMSVGKFDPQVVIDQTSQQITNVNTAVDIFMAVPTEFFMFGAIAPLGIIVIWKLIKAAWNKATGGNKSPSSVPVSDKLPAPPPVDAQAKLAQLKKSRYAADPELATAMAQKF